jgi:hypothetical protein
MLLLLLLLQLLLLLRGNELAFESVDKSIVIISFVQKQTQLLFQSFHLPF